VRLHDGSHLVLRKLEKDYDPTDRAAAARMLSETRSRGEVLTGMIHIAIDKPTLVASQKLTKTALSALGQAELRPTKEAFKKLLGGYRT
jgi:2-oxoglutarate ferredoxin oxidoreductase subunit beta